MANCLHRYVTGIANRRAFLEYSEKVNDTTLQVIISVGVAERINSDQGVHQLLKRADKFLYSAKDDGRNKCKAA